MNQIVKRIFGVVMMAIGIGIGFWLKSVHDSGATLYEKAIVLAPILLLYGALLAIAPDLTLVRGEWSEASAAKKAINIVIVIAGAGIGLWLRYTVFGDWSRR